MTPILSLTEVAVHFGGVRAVDGVSFAVEPGIIYGLVGPNGSGKSTLLGAISRLTPMTSGSMVFEGDDYSDWSAQRIARRGLGRTFQTVRLLSTLTVLDNIRLGADTRVVGTNIWNPWLRPMWSSRKDREVTEIAEAALERMALKDVAQRFPQELSYGLQRKVEIARALASGPSLLLLDEPTAGMTSDERDSISAVIRQLRDEGLTQVLVDHDVDMIVGLADVLGVMNEGRLLVEGDAKVVVRDPRVQEAYLGRRHRADA